MILSSMSVMFDTSRTSQPRPLEVAAQDVVDQGGPPVAEVGRAVDGGSAHVDAHLTGLAQRQLADLAGGGVVQAEHRVSVRGPRPAIAGDSPDGVGRRNGADPATGRASGTLGYRHGPMSTVPDKPTLDGIDDRWAQRWDEDGTYHFDRSVPRSEVFSIDTPPLDGVGVAAHRARVQLHPHRHRRPLPPHAGPAGLLPHGLGRQRPAHRAAGAELLRRPLRPVAPLRPRLRAARDRPASSRSPSAAATSSSCASSSPPSTSRPSRPSGGTSGCPWTGATTTRPSTSAPAGPARRPSCATWRGARPTSRRRRRSGTSTTAPPWPRPRWRTGRSPAPTTSSPSTGRTAAATSSSTPPVPSWWRRAWPSWPTPTTSATAR